MHDVDVQYLGSCPVCSAGYKQDKATIVEHDDERVTFHIDCVQCSSSVLVAVRSGMKGLVTTIGMPTDLTKKDVRRLRKAPRITPDEILELHSHLEKR